jgi:hypothetical protein
MSPDSEKWGYKVEMTLEEYFDAPLALPHKGIVLLVRELEKVLGKEEAHRLLGDLWEKERVKRVKEQFRKNPVSNFQEWVERREGDSSMWSHTNIDEPIIVTENTRICNTIGCLWADIYREWGAEDIGYIIECKPDFAVVAAQHPNLRLERTKNSNAG